ncbi:uroporphyrinogen-III synthase [Martelella soudanensis]|uniref:uroporphyrinogen-III synthase n=1 Tax=unclassified Martelella TaxID=2629616 RepID=UPI0015DF1DDA|nr:MULTISPECIES: uroporphyrinogen-III synthase [unclassified Martelella]
MRVLVTRPQNKAGKTGALLSAMGHQPVAMPLFETVHHPDRAREAIARGRWAALAITSTEALFEIEAAADAPDMIDRPVFAVGAETAGRAREAGFTRVFTGAGNGEELAGAIAAEPSLFVRAPLLYLAGVPRAPYLERGLAALHVPFETVTVYAMEPLDYDAAEIEALAGATDAILFYSHMTAARFFALGAAKGLAERPDPPALLCLSANVAHAVPAELAGRIRIAEAANEESLLALLG